MKKFLVSLLILLALFSSLAYAAESPSIVYAEAAEAKVTAEDLQGGTWAGISGSMYEEFYFYDRTMILTVYMVDRPELAHVSEAVFSVVGDKLILYFEKNDHTNRMDLRLEAGIPVISVKYEEEDTARIYRKVVGGSSQDAAESAVPPKATAAAASLGTKSALQAAKNYLVLMPFSHSALVERLEFKGFSHSEALYAADNCGADWFGQAERKAEQYMEIIAFSKSGLIEQLEFDGFTGEQAHCAADKIC